MQMFGVGILELLIILILIVIVVGPDRMPQVAADLARWIRQTRAYAKHLMGDFNEVVAELEKEAGASREDWKEIASVITRHTGSVGKEFGRLGRDVEEAGDIEEAKRERPAVHAATNGAAGNGNGHQASAAKGESVAAEAPAVSESTGATTESEEDEIPEEEKPWYVPERASRRRPIE